MNIDQSEFQSILQVSQDLMLILDPDELLNSVMDSVIKVIGAERGIILLYDSLGELTVKTVRNIKNDTIEDDAFQFSKSVIQEVSKTRKAVLTSNAETDPRFRQKKSIQTYNLRSILCVPLIVKERLIGVVYTDNKLLKSAFNEHQQNLLTVFAGQIAIAIENAQLHSKLQQENILLRNEVKSQYEFANIIGKSEAMQEVFKTIKKVLNTTAPVMIFGESGTGKELVARAIHYNGNRKDKRFVAQNCAVLPEQLLESELFGYKRGAFTSAMEDKSGLFLFANGGTLFLDEIADMPLAVQAKLLRVLESGEIRPLGTSQTINVDIRIITATNKEIEKEIEDKRFREDLYYRLKVITLQLPPLRERREDIPLLINYFLDKYQKKNNKPVGGISPEARLRIETYTWPGNVRELENEIERAIILSEEGSQLIPDLFSPTLQECITSDALINQNATLEQTVEEAKKEKIEKILLSCKGNRTQAAKLLGIPRQSLQRMIKRLKIQS